MKKILDFLKHPALLRALGLVAVTLAVAVMLCYIWALMIHFVAAGLYSITTDISKATTILFGVLFAVVAWMITKTALRFLARRFRDPLGTAERDGDLDVDVISAHRPLALGDQELAKSYGYSAVRDALRALPENASKNEKIALLEQLEPSQFETLSREQRARHEAEHAVVAHVLGHIIVSTDIRISGNFGGEVVLRNRKLAPEDLLRQRIAISVAPVASALRSGDLDGHSNDLLKATRDALALHLLLAKDPTQSVDSIICAAALVAEDILDLYSDAVDEITRQLLKYTHLEGRDVIQVIQEHAVSAVPALPESDRG